MSSNGSYPGQQCALLSCEAWTAGLRRRVFHRQQRHLPTWEVRPSSSRIAPPHAWKCMCAVERPGEGGREDAKGLLDISVLHPVAQSDAHVLMRDGPFLRDHSGISRASPFQD